MFVTDTHPLAYYAGKKHLRLGRRALRLFEDANRAKASIYIPTAALWELAELINVGRVKVPLQFEMWCRDMEASLGFIIEPLTWADVNEARRLPFPDLMDCLIAGTALRLDFPLITKDQTIIDSGLVETVW